MFTQESQTTALFSRTAPVKHCNIFRYIRRDLPPVTMLLWQRNTPNLRRPKRCNILNNDTAIQTFFRTCLGIAIFNQNDHQRNTTATPGANTAPAERPRAIIPVSGLTALGAKTCGEGPVASSHTGDSPLICCLRDDPNVLLGFQHS